MSPSAIQTGPSLGPRLLAARFPHPVIQPQLVETHISWIVLTGDFAYKVKKPVRFDFLDYSTLELRQRQCQREWEINRRYAPEIYLAVVPIREGEGQLVFDGSIGEIVDYAVQMRQFDQAALVDRQLAAGQIAATDMDALAAQLVRYHGDASRVYFSAESARDRAIQPALENFEYLLTHLAVSSVGIVQQLREWTIKEASKLQTWFANRASQGWIRECHGDLHLNNLLRIDDQFLAFDAIEFNERLSQIDTMCEIAFLMMELHEHGYRSHAHRLINQYVEGMNDYDGLGGLRFYLVYRAMVRAKVDLIRHTQTTGSPRTELTEDGRRYVQYAQRVAAGAEPSLWITHGLSGSGKSTAAMRLVEERGLFRVRTDVIRKQLLGISPNDTTPEDRLDEAYSAELTARVYDRLADMCEQIISAGFSPIADGAFLQRGHREAFAKLAAGLSVPLRIVDCSASVDELQRRIAHRGPDPSDANLAVLHHQLTTAEPLTDAEQEFVWRQQ